MIFCKEFYKNIYFLGIDIKYYLEVIYIINLS